MFLRELETLERERLELLEKVLCNVLHVSELLFVFLQHLKEFAQIQREYLMPQPASDTFLVSSSCLFACR